MDTPNEPEGQKPQEEAKTEESAQGQSSGSGPQSVPPSVPPVGGYEREKSSNLPPAGPELFGASHYPGSSQPPGGYGQYPRYLPWNKGPVPPGIAAVRFGAISESIELIKQDYGTYALATFVLVMVIGVISSIIRLPVTFMIIQEPKTTDNPLLLGFPQSPLTWTLYAGSIMLSGALNYVLVAGMYNLCVHRLRGLPLNIGDAFDGFKRFGSLFVAGLIYVLMTSIGFLLFVIPGLFLSGAFIFVPILIIDQKVGVSEAFRMSLEATRKDAFMMGVLLFVAGIVGAIGIIGCCIGFIFTVPITYMTIALHYHAYFPPQGGPEYAGQVQTAPAPQYSV